MSAIEKAVWKSAVEAGRIDFELIGGEGENNEYWDNWKKGIMFVMLLWTTP